MKMGKAGAYGRKGISGAYKVSKAKGANPLKVKSPAKGSKKAAPGYKG